MNVLRWRTRNLLLADAVLAVVLVALLVLISQVGVAASPGAPEPGALLYLTTFDTFNDEWDLYAGRKAAQVVEGQLQIRIDVSDDGAFSWLDRLFSDFDLTVEATQLGGPDDNGYGVIFRHRDEHHFYQFLISGDGHYQLIRRNGPNALTDVTTLNVWRRSEHVRMGQDATNVIRIVARGDTFRFYVNGQPLELCLGENAIPATCEGGIETDLLVDSTFAYGHIGVGARAFSDPGVVVGFDNMVVVGPE